MIYAKSDLKLCYTYKLHNILILSHFYPISMKWHKCPCHVAQMGMWLYLNLKYVCRSGLLKYLYGVYSARCLEGKAWLCLGNVSVYLVLKDTF